MSFGERWVALHFASLNGRGGALGAVEREGTSPAR